MLRNAIIFLVSCVALLGLFVWSENEFAHTFQSCISEESPNNSTERSNNQGHLVATIVRAQTTCSLRLIDLHNGFFAALAAIAVAAFTFTLWISTSTQAKLTGDSIKLAREEFNATHRPKIRVHAAELKRRPPEVKSDEADEYDRIAASLICFNIGESTAVNVEVRGEIFAGANFAVDVQRRLVATFPEILSGQKFRAEIKSDIPVQMVAIGKRTGIDYHCLGWIAYHDQNGLRRETAFCFIADMWAKPSERWVSAGKKEHEYEY
jgi:hypothetical protein